LGVLNDDAPLRFGFWGAGAVAARVAADLRLVGGARLHAVASRSLEAARALAARHAVERSGAGLEFLLRDAEVDIVYIATPRSCHAADAIACLDAGKAVLCEKPFALNAREAESMAAAARRSGRFCMEAMWTRFVPAVVEATAAVRAGRLGRIALMQGDFAYPLAPVDRARSGGALLDRGVYLVSLAQHWLGSSGVDEQCAMSLGWGTAADGADASLAAGLRVRGRNELWLAGEHATLRLPAPFYRAHRLEWRETAVPSNGRSRVAAEGWRARLRDAPWLWHWRRRLGLAESLTSGAMSRFDFAGHGYQFQLAEVLHCMRAGLAESPVMPLHDSVAVLRTLDRIAACFRRDG
jgi:predicted dehydrogenase